jgi:sugar fermentation stimulation protein A
MYRKVMSIDELVKGYIVRRLSRFEVLVDLGGRLEVVHNTNTGRLKDVLVSGYRALLKPISGKKLKYRLVGIEFYDNQYGIVDTLTQSKAFEEALKLKLINYLSDCFIVRRNPKYDSVVFDYLIRCDDEYAVVEIKSAEFRGSNNEAMYPDCPTLRGRKQLMKLIELSTSGMKTYLIFIAAFPNPRCFKPYRDGDAVIDELVRECVRVGVSVRAVSMFMDGQGNVYLEDTDLPLCSEWLGSWS